MSVQIKRWHEPDIRSLAKMAGLENHRLNLYDQVTVDLDLDGSRYRTQGVANAFEYCTKNKIRLRGLKFDPLDLQCDYIDFLVIPLTGDARGQYLFEISGGGPSNQAWSSISGLISEPSCLVMVWKSKQTGARYFRPVAIDRGTEAWMKQGFISQGCQLQDYVNLYCFGDEGKPKHPRVNIPLPQPMLKLSWTTINREELDYKYALPDGWGGATKSAPKGWDSQRQTYSSPRTTTTTYLGSRRQSVDITPDSSKPIQLGDFTVYGDIGKNNLATFRLPRVATPLVLLPPQEQQRSN